MFIDRKSLKRALFITSFDVTFATSFSLESDLNALQFGVPRLESHRHNLFGGPDINLLAAEASVFLL